MKKTFQVPRMVPIKKAAETVALSCYYLRQLIKRQDCEVKFIKSGRKVLINLDSLVEFLNTGENTGVTQNDDIKERIGYNG